MTDEIQSENALTAQAEAVEAEAPELEQQETPEAETPEGETPEQKTPEPESELPQFAKDRLARQEHRHKKELRAVNEKFDQVMYQLSTLRKPEQQPVNQPLIDPATGQPIAPGSVEETVIKTMQSFSAQQRAQEQKNFHDQKVATVQQKRQAFQEKLDQASDIYEDFDEVVLDKKAPITDTMADFAMCLSNGVDVLYQLGKNRTELSRIAALHETEQVEAMAELSAQLRVSKPTSQTSSNALSKGKSAVVPKPLKTNPGSSSSSRITEQSSVSDIMEDMFKNPNKWGR